MKSIPLTQGRFALVDDEDFEYLNQWKWHFNGYAARIVRGRPVLMHREIMKTPKGMDTDHVNSNKTDNRKSNLRICTTGQNMHNRIVGQKNNKSGYKGVFWHKVGGKWKAQIRINGRSIHLGLFSNIMDAVHAYDDAAVKHFGEFARLNIPRG